MKYKVEKFVLGIYMANCYLIWNGNHVLMVDPGSTSRKLLQHLKDNNAIVDAILLTHGHFDHIGGVDYFASHFNCPVYIDGEDENMLTNIHLNCSLPGRETIVKTPVKKYKNGLNKIGDFTFNAIFAPGHTHGCTMLQFENILFSGDVIFKESIGRTDLPGGSNSEMYNTLQMIKTMDPNLQVLSGHGEPSILSYEFIHNPYL